jgi:hypothetical protein
VDCAPGGETDPAAARSSIAATTDLNRVILRPPARPELATGAAMLVAEAVDADGEGRPISYAVSRFPAERIELVIGAD